MPDSNRPNRGEAASNYFDGPPPANPRSDSCWKGRDIEGNCERVTSYLFMTIYIEGKE